MKFHLEAGRGCNAVCHTLVMKFIYEQMTGMNAKPNMNICLCECVCVFVLGF